MGVAATLADFEAEAAARRRAPARDAAAARSSIVAAANAAAIGSSRPPRSTSTASSHARRPAEVVQLVDGGADRAAGVEHVVDQHDVAALDLERQLVWSAPAERPRWEKSSRCSALEITPGAPAQAEVFLQPLGEPGAAGPDADQRGRPASCSARTPASRSRVERFGVELVEPRSWQARQMLLEDDRRRRRVEVGAAGALGVGGACSARRPRAPAGRNAPRSWRREAARALGVGVRRAVGMERHADDERVRPPFVDQRGDRRSSALRPRRRRS